MPDITLVAQCRSCTNRFSYNISALKIRDLGAYPGEPHFEGKEAYVLCPTCDKEVVIRSAGEK